MRRNRFLLLSCILLWCILPASAAVHYSIIGGAASGDTTPPTLSTFVISTNGTTWTFTYDEAVQADTNAELCTDYAVTMSLAGAISLTYSSGTGTDTIVCTGSPTVASGETISSGLNYTPGSIVDLADNALASISSRTSGFTNNSTQESFANLVLRYEFEDNCTDTAGVGPYNCTATGSPTYTDSGTTGFGRAINLNGSSQYVTFGTTPQATTGNWSFAICVHRDTTTTTRMAIRGGKNGNGESAAGQVLAWFANNEGGSANKIYYQAATGSANILVTTTSALSDTTNYHGLVLTANRAGNATWYVDSGTAAGAGSMATVTASIATTTSIAVGLTHQVTPSEFLYYVDGQIAEYREYSAIMTAGQITDFMAKCQ